MEEKIIRRAVEWEGSEEEHRLWCILFKILYKSSSDFLLVPYKQRTDGRERGRNVRKEEKGGNRGAQELNWNF